MELAVGCSLNYQILSPSAHFTCNVLVNEDPHLEICAEQLTSVPEVPLENIATARGNRVVRLEASAGPLEIRYQAVVNSTLPSLPDEVGPDLPGRLPLSVLTYMLPSRYCESDRFAQIAYERFGHITNRAAQVREISRWVDSYLECVPGSTDSRTSAWEVWESRKGVCRDYSHLNIALCRALNIPTRYVGCYAAGLKPMDFHACHEVFLGGRWYVLDSSDNTPPDRLAVIARGRDAANAALTTIFGRVQAGMVRVTCEVAAPADGAGRVLPSP
jgi:transglutaminase-like putative cysteine protease